MSIVTRTVIVAVQTRMQHQHRDLSGQERIVIAVLFQFPIEVEFQVRELVAFANQTPQAADSATTIDFDAFRLHAADHVAIHHEYEAISRYGWSRCPLPGA